MELTWKRLGVSWRLRRRQASASRRSRGKRVVREPSAEQRAGPDKHYLLACGGRYVAPTR